MSEVTNLILHIRTSIDEEHSKLFKKVNEYFQEKSLGAPPVSVDDPRLPEGWYGGSTLLERNLYIAAYNHLDLGDFVSYLRTLNWEYPQYVQLMISEQDQPTFRIINLWRRRVVDNQVIRVDDVRALRKIGEVAPTEFEGYVDGHWLYVRYNRGYLEMQLWDKPEFEGKLVLPYDYGRQIGNEADDFISDEESIKWITKFVRFYKYGDYEALSR